MENFKYNFPYFTIPSAYAEGFSYYEILNHVMTNTNTLVDMFNALDTSKVNIKGDFQGTWNGLEMHQSDLGLSTDWNAAKGTFDTVTARLNKTDENIYGLVVNITEYPRLDGESNDNNRILRAKAASNTIFLPKGTYAISQLDLSNLIILGAGVDNTIIEGDGDLINNFEYATLKDLTIRNKLVRGKIISMADGSDVGRSNLYNVSFGSANYHIYAPRTIVNWHLKNCVFNDAAVISRYYTSIWAYTEEKCYTWYNQIGLQIEGGMTISLNNSVFEYNKAEGLLVNANGKSVDNILIKSTHFECNGNTTGSPDIMLTTATADRVRNILLEGCTLTIPATNQQAHISSSPSNNGSVQRITLKSCFVNGNLLNGYNLGAIVAENCEMNSGTIIDDVLITENLLGTVNTYKDKFAEIGITDLTKNRPFSAMAGNNYAQVSDVEMVAGDVHIVTVGTKAAADTQYYCSQAFLVMCDSTGTIRVTSMADSHNNVFCVIAQSSAYHYTISNGGTMTVNFNPSINITKL
jgi:hypothetical protein